MRAREASDGDIQEEARPERSDSTTEEDKKEKILITADFHEK